MRFTIRDVLLLTVIVGLSLGWWLDRRRFGLAQSHLQTLINILASHDISVQLEPTGVRAQTTAPQTNWTHYQAFGMGVIKHDLGGVGPVEYPDGMADQ
jgi:hypothetical protein